MWPRRQDAEFTLTVTCAMARACFGGNWIPIELHFKRPRPGEWQGLQTMFRAPLRFDLPPTLCSATMPIWRRPCEAMQALRRSCGTIWRTYLPAPKRTRIWFRRCGGCDAGSGPGARVCHASGRGVAPSCTITAKLPSRRCNSVHEIIREIRQEQTKSLLHTKPRQAGAVAHAVGYTDPSAFWRTFKS